MNTMSTLLLRAETNGGFQLDDGGLVLFNTSFGNGVGDRGQITVSGLASSVYIQRGVTDLSPFST